MTVPLLLAIRILHFESLQPSSGSVALLSAFWMFIPVAWCWAYGCEGSAAAFPMSLAWTSRKTCWRRQLTTETWGNWTEIRRNSCHSPAVHDPAFDVQKPVDNADLAQVPVHFTTVYLTMFMDAIGGGKNAMSSAPNWFLKFGRRGRTNQNCCMKRKTRLGDSVQQARSASVSILFLLSLQTLRKLT